MQCEIVKECASDPNLTKCYSLKQAGKLLELYSNLENDFKCKTAE